MSHNGALKLKDIIEGTYTLRHTVVNNTKFPKIFGGKIIERVTTTCKSTK